MISSTSTFSSILCIVFPTNPNSITGHNFVMNLASEVPPVVDFSGLTFTTFIIAFCSVDFSLSSLVRKGSALQK